MKTAVVTGGSSGIGKRICGMLAERGWKVYELSRNGENRPGVEHIGCDITDAAAVVDAIRKAESPSGIDLLVNNAGMGVSGAVEFLSQEDTERQFGLNIQGTLNVIRSVLPGMRRRNFGRIINLSSVAAVEPILFQAYYSASKAAINSLTLAIANEVRPFGISVCAVMPGDTKTGFTAARRKTVAGDVEYGGRISKSVATMESDEQNGVDPDKVASLVLCLVEKKKVRPLYTVGLKYKAAVALIKLLPAGTANFLIGKIYS